MNQHKEMEWTAWSTFFPELSFSPASLDETLDGGQAFRWWKTDAGIWRGVWGRHLVEADLDDEFRLTWRKPLNTATEQADVAAYFGADTDYGGIVDQLPWRSDRTLDEALQFWSGLRILCQPLEEALLAFLCSSTKQIVQIKQICALLAERFGEPIAGGVNALPNWERLASVPEAELRACKLGYRARFIHETAAFLAEHPNYLAQLTFQGYAESRATLQRLPGVGEKIADCVLLFGGGYFEAFPVDVWVLRAMERFYGLKGWAPSQVAHFGRIHFGRYAGYAQQVLFAGERRGKRPEE